MRLGIRRKLIGTLMLVGLLPLVLSLVVILVGGATTTLKEIRGRYEDTATMCADDISATILHDELEKVVMVARLPRVDAYVKEKSTPLLAGGAVPMASPEDLARDNRWPGLKASDPELAAILQNEISLRLQLLSEVDGHLRHVMVTNTRGELIAADVKTDDYFQADEAWWQVGYDKGRGQLYVSSITTSSGGAGKFSPGERVVEIVVPIYESIGGNQVLIGILKDELSVTWLLRSLQEVPATKKLNVHMQLVDLNMAPEHMTVYEAGDREGPEGPAARKALAFYLAHKDGPRVGTFSLLNNGLVIGWKPVEINAHLRESPAHLFPGAQAPDWVVLVSQSSDAAMTPVYGLATIVAVIGFALPACPFCLPTS